MLDQLLWSNADHSM